MWRSAGFIRKTEILNPRNLTLGQFPRKLRAVRVLRTKECEEPVQCPDPCDDPCLMDLMPVPCGSWQEKFDKKMRESNRVLMLGTGFFLFTVITTYKIGYIRGYDCPLF